MTQIEKRGEFFKVAGKLIYGWALVSEEKNASGEWVPYVDTQNDHIPEDVMVEAAIDFAKNSRIGKDMHAGDKVANVPLVYVVTKASTSLDIETKKTGMLIGWEPDDPALVEAVARGERTGFSIGGFVHESDNSIGKVAKAAGSEDTKPPRVFRRFEISEISLVDMPAMEGATIGYFKNADGTARRVIAKRTVKRGNYDIPVTVTIGNLDEKSLEKKVVEVIERNLNVITARTGTTKSTHPNLTRKVEPIMTDEDKLKAKIAELEAELAALKAKPDEDEAEKRLVVLTPDQHAHYVKLHGRDALAFAGKSDAERTQIVKAALEADPVVYTTKTGIEIRKSQGALMKQLAEDNDATATELEKSRAANQETILKARAKETIGHLAGTTEGHVALIKAIDSISDEKLRAEAVAALKAADAIMASKGIVPGFSGSENPSNGAPADRFNALVEKHMADHKVTKGAATEAVLNTTEGKAAYAELRKSIVHRN